MIVPFCSAGASGFSLKRERLAASAASQTGKNASERLKNVEHIFELRNPAKITGKKVLLVDDVITTGATIGACLQVLAQAGNVRFSLGCLAQTV